MDRGWQKWSTTFITKRLVKMRLLLSLAIYFDRYSHPCPHCYVRIVGALAAFPLVHIFWKSRDLKVINWWDKITAKWRKPPVLESDKFLHQRDLNKLIAISQQAEAINADKFSNEEFKIFVKIKSFISRSLGEYTNLDEIIEMLNAAIITQNSFLSIEQTESRYCSATQQKLYHHVQNLLNEGVNPGVLNQEN